jgi:hypothetical protein
LFFDLCKISLNFQGICFSIYVKLASKPSYSFLELCKALPFLDFCRSLSIQESAVKRNKVLSHQPHPFDCAQGKPALTGVIPDPEMDSRFRGNDERSKAMGLPRLPIREGGGFIGMAHNDRGVKGMDSSLRWNDMSRRKKDDDTLKKLED